MAHYLVPPEGKPASIAPSLIGRTVKKDVGTNGNTKANGNTSNITIGTSNAITNGTTNGTINGTTNHAAHIMVNDTANGINYYTANGNGGIANDATDSTINRPRSTPYPYRTGAEPGNPTVVPARILKQFHFAFLIRHPRKSIPSYYRCTIPPLDRVTGFYNFMPSEAGYNELRRIFDFLRSQNQIGPTRAGERNDSSPLDEVRITVIDADDMLDNPQAVIEAFCKEVGLGYSPQMLNWDSDVAKQEAKDTFAKWSGFHEDAIDSSCLKPQTHAHVSTSFRTDCYHPLN
jgi:hypothetical protein